MEGEEEDGGIGLSGDLGIGLGVALSVGLGGGLGVALGAALPSGQASPCSRASVSLR